MLGPAGSTRDSAQETFRILIIEHDTDLARLLMTSLATAGFECRHAPDGDAGISSFAMSHPHLVLLDLAIPGLSGHDVCAKIRETSLIPVITLTAATSEAEQLEAFKIGADDFVLKPVSPKLLVARVLAFLRRVYRYDPELQTQIRMRERDRQAAQRQALGTTLVPTGWASCNICNYMGPRERFERFNPEGAMVMICPNCHHKEDISFSIG
ncbi:MAG: response regulator transcription factor [Abitibacteriaceae bacterium]|nr:response regulator transcription factor [Abditibacteriaceae bacterium]